MTYDPQYFGPDRNLPPREQLSSYNPVPEDHRGPDDLPIPPARSGQPAMAGAPNSQAGPGHMGGGQQPGVQQPGGQQPPGHFGGHYAGGQQTPHQFAGAAPGSGAVASTEPVIKLKAWQQILLAIVLITVISVITYFIAGSDSESTKAASKASIEVPTVAVPSISVEAPTFPNIPSPDVDPASPVADGKIIPIPEKWADKVPSFTDKEMPVCLFTEELKYSLEVSVKDKIACSVVPTKYGLTVFHLVEGKEAVAEVRQAAETKPQADLGVTIKPGNNIKILEMPQLFYVVHEISEEEMIVYSFLNLGGEIDIPGFLRSEGFAE